MNGDFEMETVLPGLDTRDVFLIKSALAAAVVAMEDRPAEEHLPLSDLRGMKDLLDRMCSSTTEMERHIKDARRHLG